MDHGFYTDLEYLLLPVPYVQTVAFLNLTIYMYRVSLSTQSMNMKSLQKNVAMHEKVLSRLLEEYRTHSWDSRVGSYMLRRIAIMAVSYTHLDVYKRQRCIRTHSRFGGLRTDCSIRICCIRRGINCMSLNI